MTSSTVPGPKSRKTGPGKTGAPLGPGRLTRMLVVKTVPDTGLDIRRCASKTECAVLADDYGLVAVETFETGFHVRKQGPKRYKVSGVLHALVTQTCGVSLEPFETLVSALVEGGFRALPSALRRAGQPENNGGQRGKFCWAAKPPRSDYQWPNRSWRTGSGIFGPESRSLSAQAGGHFRRHECWRRSVLDKFLCGFTASFINPYAAGHEEQAEGLAHRGVYS